MKNYSVPKISGEYFNVYKPKEDTYKGEDTASYKNGELYKDWTVNDFSVVHKDNNWHLIGITHPKPKDFIDDFKNNPYTLHEAEWQLFHCEAEGKNFKDVLHNNSFTDGEKILYPSQRVGERNEIWAPHIALYNDMYHLIYSPGAMRLAVSKDLYEWQPKGVLFNCNDFARDPNIFIDDDNLIYMFYANENRIDYRVSSDMKNWGEEKTLQVNPFKKGVSESPFMIKREGVYYLFWCINESDNSSYDHRTFVFAAESLNEFEGAAPLTVLNAHAPEIIKDNNGDYYIASAFYPQNGVNVAKLFWI